jgi:tetratricopeptide (TPR) repeat protein
MNSSASSNNEPKPPATPIYVASEEAKAKARKFFDHAKKAEEAKNYEYAVKLYVDGLAFWPDSVEEGLKPLRVVATARHLDGGKSAGFMAARKWPTNTKDALKNLNSGLYLFGLDPTAIGSMEVILKNASKARLIRTVAWIAPVLTDAYNSAKKPSEAQFHDACQAMSDAADFAMALAEDKISMDILQANIATAQIWNTHHPDSTDAPRARSHASGKLTIVKGKFDKAEGFQESLKDAEGQRDLMDKERVVLPADRQAALIAQARADWEANREVPAKLLTLTDRMIKDEDEAREREAIALLDAEYAAHGHYHFKSKADEIRMRQIARRRRGLESRLKADPKNEELHKALNEVRLSQNQIEIDILLDRQRQYPTDMKIRFQLGVRYLNARRFDEAIPLFQQAQVDGRTRVEARLYMGRCFFEKRFYPQAIETFRTTLSELETNSGPVVLELNYWLGRALEATNAAVEAKKIYGYLIQLDYNYKDARQRLESLFGES